MLNRLSSLQASPVAPMLIALLMVLALGQVTAQAGQADDQRRAWEHKEMMKSKRAFDAAQAMHPMTDAQAKAMADRDFNAMIAKEQLTLMKQADQAGMAFMKALMAKPQDVAVLNALMEKAQQADLAVRDGWARIDQLLASEAKQATREKLLDDLLNKKAP